MLQATVNGKNTIAIAKDGDDWMMNDKPVQWDMRKQANGLISILHNGKSYTAIVDKIDRDKKEVTVRINGNTYTVAIQEPIDQLLHSMGLYLNAMKKAEHVKAPMPGMILKVLVEPGQQIKKGDGLLILEAMKMENVLKATGDATVKAIKVTERTAVEKGAVLIEMD